MPKSSVTVPHTLGADEAKRRLSGMLAQTREQFADSISDVQETWNGYVNDVSFRALGFHITGAISVEPAQVQVDIQFPFAALPFKSRIEREIVEHARALLA